MERNHDRSIDGLKTTSYGKRRDTRSIEGMSSALQSPENKLKQASAILQIGTHAFSEFVTTWHRFRQQCNTLIHFSFLCTPCVAVTVGSGADTRTYHLHKTLLYHEPSKVLAHMMTGFEESQMDSLLDCEEDIELFGCFVEYLYRDDWADTEGTTNHEDYVRLARLYSIGERLGAERFQKSVLRKFLANLIGKVSASSQTTCELLEVVCTELQERTPEDPLREFVFGYAARRLSSLKTCEAFQRMLVDIPELGRYLCLRAGDGSFVPVNQG